MTNSLVVPIFTNFFIYLDLTDVFEYNEVFIIMLISLAIQTACEILWEMSRHNCSQRFIQEWIFDTIVQQSSGIHVSDQKSSLLSMRYLKSPANRALQYLKRVK